MSTNNDQVRLGDLPDGTIVVASSRRGWVFIKTLLNKRDAKQTIVSTTVTCTHASDTITTTSPLRYIDRNTTLSRDSGVDITFGDIPSGECTFVDVQLDTILNPDNANYREANDMFGPPSPVRRLMDK
ncbi:MAG: hypothetical protein Q4A34_04240 [Candidatus Saccharibacteria bacterium]|nr:hypothetical protein [Candidatus Saccharibacteria bacterium]